LTKAPVAFHSKAVPESMSTEYTAPALSTAMVAKKA
jgi:hypothetical protein